MGDQVLQIRCPRGCGATVAAARPALEPLPQVPDPDRRSPYPNPHERRMFEQTGQAVCEALLAHALFECPAFAAENADCGERRGPWVCNLQTGHDGQHEHQVDLPDRTVTRAAWPNLRSVPDV